MASLPAPSARLTGRIALVTGGLGGIGGAIAGRFLAEGADVWIGDLDPFGGGSCPTGADRYLVLDVTREDHWCEAAERIGSAAGRLDVLVNNAGVAPTGAVAEMAVCDWRRTMAVNAEGAFLGARMMRALLAEAGGGAERGWASVVNLSSILGIVGMPDSSAYAASKGAIRALSRALAIEFAAADTPIRVNSVHPGFVRTALTEAGAAAMNGEADLLALLAGQTPMRRLARAEEVAAAVLFLASDESSFVTGAELVIDGGWTAQ